MAKPKFDPEKAFKNITGIKEETQSEETEGVDTIIISVKKEETRCKRVNLVIKPSVHEDAKKKCEQHGVSLNECINQLLENWIKG